MRPEQLQDLGYKAFRAGDYTMARRHFEQAWRVFARRLGQDHASTLGALSDLGAAHSALGDHAAARAAHEKARDARRNVLGEAHQDVGVSAHNLGLVAAAQGDWAAAETCQAEALRIWQNALGATHPVTAKALAALGVLARQRGDFAAALASAQEVLAIRRRLFAGDDPQIAMALDDLGKAQAQSGDYAAACRAWEAALSILRARPGKADPNRAPLMNNLGVARRLLLDLAGAERWFAAAVTADPLLAAARHNLAAVLARLGRADDAKRQRDDALRQQSVFIQTAERPKARVLILSISDDGNIPLEHLLPERDFTRIWWFIAHAGAALGDGLPPYDVIFNGIGDPDMVGDAHANLARFLNASPRHVLNPPDRVARTRRDLLPETLSGIEGIVVPKICRLPGTLAPGQARHRIEQAGMTPPFLLRPIGSHGGAGVLRIDAWEDFDASTLATKAEWYCSQFHDCRSADGFVRKYRCAFIGSQALPYHEAISPDWLVHYFSAEMQTNDWKLAEEAAFLDNPRASLGPVAYAAVAAIGERLGMAYCGIDFSVLPDGRAIIFEANATMLIHPEPESGKLAFKNMAVAAIVEAMGHLIAAASLDRPIPPGHP